VNSHFVYFSLAFRFVFVTVVIAEKNESINKRDLYESVSNIRLHRP